VCCHRDRLSGKLKWALLALLAALAAATSGSAGAAEKPASPAVAGWRESAPEVAPGAAMAPNFGTARDGVLLTWLEKLPAGGHALRFSRRRAGGAAATSNAAAGAATTSGAAAGAAARWTPPVTIAAGTDFFANWADFPAVAEAADGSLVAHWLAKTGGDTYAYGIHLARSTDGGATWKAIGLLHDDGIPAEHGFVSFVPEGQGLRAFWLDGRDTPGGGAMALRTAVISAAATVGRSEVIDRRVCDCCQTGAAVGAAGPVVVYRDRSDAEIRDMSIVRRLDMGWSAPATVHADNWKIPGCPVNGPSVAAAGKRVAVAWFTDAQPGARVQAVFSEDGGRSFGAPTLIDGERPMGRVGLQLAGPDGNDAVVVWLAMTGDRAEVRLRRLGADGNAGAPVVLAATTAARSSGVPRIALAGDELWAVWVEDGDAARLRVGSLPLAKLPR
jgi:hypothetical protein